MKFWLFSIISLIAVKLSAQTKEWKEAVSDDGMTKVVYAIYDSANSKSREVKCIEYKAKTITSASVDKCAEVFNSPEMHKKIYEYTEQSKRIKDISKNEWIVYYYYSPPWPISNSDCVSKITRISDSTKSRIVFKSISNPNLIEKKDVARSELNNITFTFTKIDESKTEINISAILIPTTSAPNWMMSGWFPKGPAGILSRFKKLAEVRQSLKN
jgi:hypothetical protein